MSKMTFILPGGTRKDIETKSGETILVVAHRAGIPIEGACEGSMACSTCHVIVDPAMYDRLPPASVDEEDMLDMAFGLTRTSRLGCQVILAVSLDGLIVALPETTRNLLRE